MLRGVASQDGEGAWYVDEEEDLLNHPKLAGRQSWTEMDRRGNWLKFEEKLDGADRTEDRTVNDANEYLTVNPGTGLGMMDGKNLKYDLAGNLTFNRWAKNVGDVCLPLADGHVAKECRETPNDPQSACDAEKPGCGLGQEYEYDGENRLMAIHRDTNDAPGPFASGQLTEPKLMEFIYDALGRRVETIEYVDAATGQVMDGQGGNPQPRRTRHVYFGLELIQEYSCGADGTTPPMGGAWPCSTSMPLVREFFHGDPERYPEAVAMIRHNPDTQDQWTYHYLHDVLGSVIGLVDSAGTLIERYTYDPYGKVFIEKWDATANGGQGDWAISAEPASGMPHSSVGNPFLWTGHRYDPAVGLYHTLFRTYSPTLGRWLQRDPIEYEGGSVNLYEYVQSAPVGLVDPMGLASLPSLGPLRPQGPLDRIQREMSDPWQRTADEAGLPWSTPPGDPLKRFDWCNGLANYINNLRKSIHQRKADLENNPGELHWDSCGKIRDDQKGHLRQLLFEKLLLQWAEFQFERICKNNNMVGVPKPVPVRGPVPGTATVKKVAVCAGTAGGCYVIYRVIRMIPSLAFPPSIPPNLVIP